MSQTNIAITQLAQVGLAERIAQETQGHPEVTKQAAQQAAPETLKRQEARVAESEKSKNARIIKEEKDRQNASSQGNSNGRKKYSPKEEEPKTGTNSGIPWSGNILNVKV